MFEMSFGEMVVVFVVGLIVLGPTRLPVAIKTVLGWIQLIRGTVANVQNELTKELKLQELQENIKKAEALNLQNLSPELAKTVEDLKAAANKMQGELKEVQALSQAQVSQIQGQLEAESQRLIAQSAQEQAAAEALETPNAPESRVETDEKTPSAAPTETASQHDNVPPEGVDISEQLVIQPRAQESQ